ncbi:cysteine-rich receptor-like protein kinase 1 [Tasmannia lanceolata]|uniref:cysteine-rich receptor-like protein kinase 1 n=1 Tax=Tasmannia lanceolata TaxID=3420 RepID=UPI0040633626
MRKEKRRRRYKLGANPMSRFLLLIFIFTLTNPCFSQISLDTTLCDRSDGSGASDEILNQTLSCLLVGAGSGNSTYCVRGKEKKIYGFAQCRGDLTSGDCSTCVREAGLKGRRECGGGKAGAKVFREECVVFYQQSPFSGEGYENPVKGPECGMEEGKGDPGRFWTGVRKVLEDLSLEAGAKGGNGFGVGNSGGIFAIGQCWSVVGERCGNCLGRARDALAGICLPRSEGGMVFDGCFIRYQSFPFGLKREIPRSMPPQLISPSPSKLQLRSPSLPPPHGASAKYFFLGGIILLVVSAILILVFCKCIKPSRLRKKMVTNESLQAPNFFSGNLRTISYFDYQTLKKATRNFHPKYQLGRGGFGPVYKGKLEDGMLVAVKKLAAEKSLQGEEEFLAEVRMITSIQHKNLVRLLGCCSDGSQRLLVYEYMKNRSLDLIVYGKSDQFLTWKTRFQIILGIARGLQYLHEDSHLRIVHRDIKASNVLLDEKFQPKIGDFGLARFFPEDQSYLSTNFAGTLGYTAPEYAIRGELSEKADIYSFGVLVLEIVSCRKNTDHTLASDLQYLPEYAWKLYETSSVIDLVDPRLQADGFVETDVLQAINVALLCIQSSPSLRPPMSEIVAMLTCKVECIGTPMKPAFLNRKSRSKMKQSWENLSESLTSFGPSDSPSFPHPDKSSSS